MSARNGEVAVFLFVLAAACADDVAPHAATAGSGASGGTGTGGDAGGAGGSGGTATGVGPDCSDERDLVLGLIDEVSEGEVIVLSQMGSALELYVDASAGGFTESAHHPWIYLRLADGTRAEVTDEECFDSTEWDLALKRFIIRSNSGDSGPGMGGAAFLATVAFADVDADDAMGVTLSPEDWFDEDCEHATDEAGALATTFSSWYDYEAGTLTPKDGVYLVAGAGGALYKLQFLDYYANPDGTSGQTSARFRLRVAPLE
jgi:hypothetical protein